jgi:hypothetical protein
MLSAMAFERLLEPANNGAPGVAEEFRDIWTPFSTVTIATAKRVKPDNDAKFAAEQISWPVHRKWMKELYEARSARAHRGARPRYSQNWKDWQHMVIAGFTFPLTVKLKLAQANLYFLDDKEIAACELLDELLDSNWGNGWRRRPDWPEILSMAEAHREFMRSLGMFPTRRNKKKQRRRATSQ